MLGELKLEEVGPSPRLSFSFGPRLNLLTGDNGLGKSFVLELLDQPQVIDGSADTGWIDRVRAEGGLVANRHSAIALIAAAIDAYEEEELVGMDQLAAQAQAARQREYAAA